MDSTLILNPQSYQHTAPVSASIYAMADSPRRANLRNADFAGFADAANQTDGTNVNKWQSHAGDYPRG
jgi:hypothetical protein